VRVMPPAELEAEIASAVEALFNVEPDRTGTLLALLAQCQASHVARIFHCLPDPAPGGPLSGNRTAAQPAKRSKAWVWTRYWQH
jgi:hypothetical protein